MSCTVAQWRRGLGQARASGPAGQGIDGRRRRRRRSCRAG
jgi:hypothetical protein